MLFRDEELVDERIAPGELDAVAEADGDVADDLEPTTSPATTTNQTRPRVLSPRSRRRTVPRVASSSSTPSNS
jgi:hypothetical protein